MVNLARSKHLAHFFTRSNRPQDRDSPPEGRKQDSVAETATLTTFALFLSFVMTTVSGAPAFDVHVEMRDEPWIHSCGTPVAANLRQNTQRHSVHRALKRVRTQLRVAQNHFKKENKDVQEIYAKVTKELKEQYSVPWLPEKQFEWYHSEVWCLDKAKKAELALPKLHDTLQRFAITFHHLKLFDLESHLNTDAREKRNKIVSGMYHEILRMLCEVETAMTTLGIELPPSHRAAIVTESPNWTTKADFTRMLVQDSGILRLYQIFLNDWVRALRNATATGPGTCDPTKPREPVVRPKKEKKIQQQGKNNSGKKKKKIVGRKRLGMRKGGTVKRPLATNGGRTRGKGLRRKLDGNKQRKTL